MHAPKSGWILIAVCLLWGSLAHATTVPGFDNAVSNVLDLMPEGGNGVAADLDGDGADDFVFCGGFANAALVVVGRLNNDSIGFKQLIDLPIQHADLRNVLLSRRDDGAHIYVVSSAGFAYEFAGWPLQEVARIAIPMQVLSATMGDLYGNGGSELLIGTADAVQAFDADGGMVLWSVPASYPYALEVAQLDADPALEIIVGSSPSFVLDGASQAVDWTASTSFGFLINAGRLGSVGAIEFATSDDYSVNVYKGAPWGLDWSTANSATGFSAMTVADLDHNGKDVIIIGDSQWGSLHIFDPATHLERASITNPGWGTHGITVGDVDGDGIPEILLTAATTGVTGTLIELVDSQSGAVKWSFAPLSNGGFAAVALGDVDGDGKLDLVVAGYNMTTYGPGTIAVLDASTGALKWRSPVAGGSLSDPFVIGTVRILLVPHSSDVAQDIVLFGNTMYDGRIVVFDGLTHTVRLNIYQYGSGPLVSRQVVNGAMVDIDNDGVVDFVAATRGEFSGPNNRLQVFSGMDGHLLWDQSVGTSTSGPIVDVIATGPASDPTSELIAVMHDGLAAYNIQTQTATWSLLASADGAVLIPNGVFGAELAVFTHDGNIAFYDRATRAFLRSFATYAPLTGLAPLDGTANNLLLASANRLQVVDGTSGAAFGTSAFYQQGLADGNELSVVPLGPAQWVVAAGDNIGAYRLDIVPMPDDIFGDGFGV